MSLPKILILSILTVFSTIIFAQQNQFVIVKVFEPVNKPGEIVISYGNDNAERVKIEQLNSQHHENNLNTLIGVFSRLDSKGFELISSSSSSHGNSASILHVETYIFSRKD